MGSSASVLVVQLCACKACVCILSLQIHATLESACISILRTRARGYFPRSLPQDMGADAPTRFHPSPSPDWPTPRRGSRDSRRLGAASPYSVTFRSFGVRTVLPTKTEALGYDAPYSGAANQQPFLPIWGFFGDFFDLNISF